MASVVERMARAGHPSLDQLTPEEAKASYERGAGVLEVPKPELARIEDFEIAARDGHAIPARLYAPSRATKAKASHASSEAVGNLCAGGTLAAVCAILARDAGLPLALQLLIYPGMTGHQDTESHRRYAQGPLLTKALIDYFFGQYVRSPADRDDWRFAPLIADDVDDVAPAWIALAECDPVVDEGIAYADKLRAAGVPVDLEIYRGVIHEFLKMGRAVPEALQAQDDAAKALREALRP
ncbi:alpha/beta hydrolase fold domain-containing protein [Variovorax sp. CT11-76]